MTHREDPIRCYHSGQKWTWSDDNEGVLCIPQISSISGTSPSDFLVLYPGHPLEESYPSAEMGNWTKVATPLSKDNNCYPMSTLSRLPASKTYKYINPPLYQVQIYQIWIQIYWRLPFQQLLHHGVGECTTPLPGLLHFTLDPYLIVLSSKQGSIKYRLRYDLTWDWTLVSQTIGEHSTH